MLEALGVDGISERVYRALLAHPGSSISALATAAGVSPARVRASLDRLQSARLVQRLPDGSAEFTVTPPDVAITALVNERQHTLDNARLAIQPLLMEYRAASARADPSALIEVQSGPTIAAERFRELQATATQELLGFDRMTAHEESGKPEVEAEAPMLERGVRCRAIYETAALTSPSRLPYIRQLVALGEQAKVTDTLPFKMIIADRKVAMLPLVADGPRTDSLLIVYSSTLLDGLIDLFESYWHRGAPIRALLAQASPVEGLSQEELEVLELLHTGLKDEAIARQLGVSIRTARRRVTSLLNALGVGTRFQAGAEATRRGLI
ncbi:helix-turn-helix domain-containing protein [Kribbella sancticallisti]|uniref:Helix-turn-helix domain-containing protein n=1 Tax=Kribbella sancticallisti TaxID=460087 RepID=A0ABN2CN10_9ACTN